VFRSLSTPGVDTRDSAIDWGVERYHTLAGSGHFEHPFREFGQYYSAIFRCECSRPPMNPCGPLTRSKDRVHPGVYDSKALQPLL
jgi:hypothetical protein